MSLRNYLKGIADALRSNGANNEPINAQDFSYKIYEIAEYKHSAGMAEGYNTGQEVGYENGHEEGYNKGYLDASPQETVSGETISITDISPIEHNMWVSVRGKNILKYPYYHSTKTLSGITYTDNGDGSITVNGTATAFTIFELTQQSKMDCSDLFVDGVTYKMSNTEYAIVGFVLCTREISTNKAIYYYGGSSFKVDKSVYKYEWIRLQVSAGTTVNNYTVYPMIEEGTTSTSFTPYIEDISTVKLFKSGEGVEPIMYDVQADGTVEGVKSLYPSTSLYTDTSGAVIDCTYYQDGKKVKENLTNKFASTESITEEVTE